MRCTHRPSKRMEQLVHLRLKTIYKAFKQSNANNTNNNKSLSSFATSAPKKDKKVKSTPPNPNNTGTPSQQPSNGTVPPAKKKKLPPTMADHLVDINGIGSYADNNLFPGQSYYDYNTYTPPYQEYDGLAFQNEEDEGNLEEKQKEADAAAEALLAELQEEEEAAKTKASKKKKKKASKQPPSLPPLPPTPTPLEETKEKGLTLSKKDGVDDGDGDGNPMRSQLRQVAKEDEKEEEVNVKSQATPSRKKNKSKKKAPPLEVPKLDDSTHDSLPINHIPIPVQLLPEPVSRESEPEVDPLEKRLYECVENDDADGIEDILFGLKGVPGQAALRKNAKKALKRLRTPANEDVEQSPKPLVPATESAPRTNGVVDLLRMVSDRIVPGKQPATTRAECVMQIAPVLVGWVIGKGGQRIRDLMEESGARIWIDQEKAQPEGPRSVYISGDRRSVDQAVYMVRDCVSKAPIEGAEKYAPPPFKKLSVEVENPQEAVGSAPSTDVVAPSGFDRREAPVTSQPSVDIGGDDIPSTSVIPWSFLNDTGTPEMFEHVLTCEARFVPLLIGKRGWAIKDIQDKSGARIDIDQTMTPRMIRISGSKDSVDKAIPMVRDVLSYPHAQPQIFGILEDEGDELVGIDAVWQDELEKTPAIARAGDRTPPPYSYITTGDAKSAVSASSSLSSTPEPSVAPSLKTAPAQFSTGFLIAPPEYQLPHSSHVRPHIPPGFHSLPDDPATRGMSHTGEFGGYDDGAFMRGQSSALIGLPPHQYMYYPNGPSPPILHPSPSHSPGMGPGTIPPQLQFTHHHAVNGSAPYGVGIVPSDPNSTGFEASSGNQVGRWSRIAPIREAGDMLGGNGLPVALTSSNLRPSGFVSSSSFRPTSAIGPAIPAGPYEGCGTAQMAEVSGVSSTSFGRAGPTPQVGSLQDDSILIASLFGETSTSNIDSAENLVPGLSSLHLGRTAMDGLWGDASAPSWNAPTDGITSSVPVPTLDSKDIGLHHYLTMQSPMDSRTDSQQHPQHRSRFHWNSTNA